MQETGNYKLKKPGGEDVVNIDDLNANSDIIDSELAKKAQKIHEHANYAEWADITCEEIRAFDANADMLDNSRNWNTYTTAGQYRVVGHYDIYDFVGPPGGYDDGILLVFTSKNQNGANCECITQLYISQAEPRNFPISYRMKDDGYWSSWYEIKDTVYEHPSAHTASMITEDRTHRFTTDSEKSAWNEKANTKTYTTTISTAWTGSNAPYKQTITVNGIVATDNPIIDCVLSTTTATALLQEKAWNCISRITTAANSITVVCNKKKPNVAIPIQLKVVK